jgi:fused signal recognition particle receptor
MLLLIILLVVILVVLVATAAFVVTRRREEAPGIEPPPVPRTREMPTGSPVPDLTVPAAGSPEQAPPVMPVPPVEHATAPQPVETGAAAEPDLVPEPEPVELDEEPPVRPSFRERLTKARGLISGYVGSVLSRSTIDQETWDDLEEALIRADVGVSTTASMLDELRSTVDAQGIKEPEVLLEALKAQVKTQLASGDRSLRLEPGAPNVWLFVGVNGVGKTTTIGKVGRRLRSEGREVVMAAGDTFRAAAGEQLEQWAERTGSDFVRGAEGGDPSAVIFDAVQRAAARGHEVVLADTADRLHTKVNLMEELRKVRRVADKEPGKVTEVLLVLDATTGQNGLVQAQQFTEAVEVTGVVLTKLDGSAKGGIVLAIQSTLGIPIKLVGLGETADDLVDFDPDEFVEALFATT